MNSLEKSFTEAAKVVDTVTRNSLAAHNALFEVLMIRRKIFLQSSISSLASGEREGLFADLEGLSEILPTRLPARQIDAASAIAHIFIEMIEESRAEIATTLTYILQINSEIPPLLASENSESAISVKVEAMKYLATSLSQPTQHITKSLGYARAIAKEFEAPEPTEKEKTPA